jgi:multiple sugar transport system permease protein
VTTDQSAADLAAVTTVRRSARRSGWQGGPRTFKYLAMAPLALFFVVLVAFPVGQLVWMSFGRIRLTAGHLLWSAVGLDNYRRAATDEAFRASLGHSVTFVVFTVVITLLLGTALALATDRIVRFRSVLQNILLWPAVVAPVVISVVWLLILSPQIGLLNRVLDSLGQAPQAWLGDPTGAMAVVIAVDVWHWTPIVYLFVYTALRGLDSSVIEAASIDGAGYWQALRHVVLPLLAPAIAAAAVIRIVMGVKVFDEMYLLTFGGPGTATTVVSIYLRAVFFDAFQYGYGAALSVSVVLLVVLVMLLAAALRAALRRRSRYA